MGTALQWQRVLDRRKVNKGGKGGGGKGPQTGCWTCGGPHYSNQCPMNTGGKGGGKSWGGGYGNGYNYGGGKGYSGYGYGGGKGYDGGLAE